PEQVGAIGICGLAGMAVTAAGSDSRIKAVATSAMYDMSESISDHYNGAYYTTEQRELVKKHLAKMRDEEAKTGKSIRGAHELEVDGKGNVLTFDTMFPDKLPTDANPVIQDFYGYYVGRAYHPRAINSNTLAWDSTTPYGFFDFRLMDNIDELGETPVLLITGDVAHSKYFSDNVYEKIAGPKEEIVVPGATHVDLYDQMDKIPFDRLLAFFDENLK
nr:alpha/beta hydrolase [Schwartzia sp. (in: firmicutes)]